jgi:fibronectin-binding autotransporter adhesin
MKKFLSFIFALMMCMTAQASLFDGRYSAAQVFDVARSGCYSPGGPCSVSNMITPFIAPYTNWTHVNFATGDYVQFYDTGAASNNIGMKQYAADGTYKGTISNSGYVLAIGTGIVYIGVPNVGGGTGYFISNGQGFAQGSATTFTVQYSNPTMSQLANYSATTTPLAAGQSAPPPSSSSTAQAAPVDNTTSAGTMPGGFIGRVLNNTPNTWQTYSFTFTPTSSGSNYVMLSFRQDPAYWSVDNITVKAAGSNVNLLTNGDLSNGGTITAQTNNGPMSVNTPTNWGVAYQAGIYPGAAGTWTNGLWFDGAVGSFDAIYQAVSLTAGTTYTISFSVSGNHTSDTSLSGSVQLGVYAGPCGNLTLAPDQCTLPSTSGYTTLATPQEGASAGNPAPTVIGTNTVNQTSSSSSSSTTQLTEQFNTAVVTGSNWNYNTYNFSFSGSVTDTTVTTVTTPVTTTYYSDGTSTTSNGTPTTSQTVTRTYSITPNQSVSPADLNPYRGTVKNAVYIDQTIGSASNTITAAQKGQGNLIEMQVTGVSNQVAATQGYILNSLNVPVESVMISTNNFSQITLNGNNNTALSQQNGNNNSSLLNIVGNYNIANTVQVGSGNQSYATVTGNNSTNSINQQGNNNLSATNSQGNGNNITVGQTGNNNSSLISAVNAGGPVTVNLLQQAVTQGQTFVVQQTCTNGAGCSVSVVQNR